MNQSKHFDFLRSALTLENPFMPTETLVSWMKAKNEEVVVNINPMPLEKLRLWHFDEATGDLVHDSGKFFSIIGIDIQTDWGNVPHWQQPIINQAEVGFLGFVVKKINGVLHFLMQAKIEPGNINYVQLSPTIQATKSNYTQVHKGKKPLYLEYFNGEKPVDVLVDQLQSEQGARFLRKRNRNVIVEVSGKEADELPEYDNFCWLTLGQIKYLLQHDNLINMDTRTVISCIAYGSFSADITDLYNTLQKSFGVKENPYMGFLTSGILGERQLHNTDTIISWITRLKSRYDLFVNRMPLKDVQKWTRDDMSIFHEEGKYFSVIGVEVEIGNREVQTWCQPLVKSSQEGIIAYIVKRINGVYHFLVQAKLESGNFDIIELAPTVQCLTGNYRAGLNEYTVPFLDIILSAKKEQIIFDAFQSEEGGRFFREQNRNIIMEVGDEFGTEVPDNYIWMTLEQILTFIKFNNFLNVEARSLISAIRFA
ncbi:MAG: hypothetical protein DDT42_01777 [candidate division WS2 bacterium]|uniref:dTDP-4-dehydro-6-deoxy-alpha-D-glucopyranose 2,3-dehydratase domain-containing protein n=1 Tax=Psychracetigena formicireducens TaxID=2986056 RepID=A0A9E2BJZ8_PSYF1|nr:hypothetical protein [Candidatus Psychracetigena formicireducens]